VGQNLTPPDSGVQAGPNGCGPDDAAAAGTDQAPQAPKDAANKMHTRTDTFRAVRIHNIPRLRMRTSTAPPNAAKELAGP
jgi:hypothetical protein